MSNQNNDFIRIKYGVFPKAFSSLFLVIIIVLCIFVIDELLNNARSIFGTMSAVLSMAFLLYIATNHLVDAFVVIYYNKSIVIRKSFLTKKEICINKFYEIKLSKTRILQHFVQSAGYEIKQNRTKIFIPNSMLKASELIDKLKS